MPTSWQAKLPMTAPTMRRSTASAGGDAEHAYVAALEWLAAEQFGERRGDRVVAVPDEQIEQEPAEEHDADGNGEQGRAGLERESRDIVHGAQAQQQAEQRESDEGGEQRVEKRRPEPLAERCAGLRQGAQTFSTSGRPSRPVGKKISTIASMEKAATSLYSMVK